MRDANAFGYHGSIAKNPRILIAFKGEEYGDFNTSDDRLLDGLAWHSGATIREHDNWLVKNADETVTLETETLCLRYKLRDFPEVKKLLEAK